MNINNLSDFYSKYIDNKWDKINIFLLLFSKSNQDKFNNNYIGCWRWNLILKLRRYRKRSERNKQRLCEKTIFNEVETRNEDKGEDRE